ncbi:MAG TPA: aminoglycoside phosphotransferase family protein [Bacteroidetes bacterium]|nr:aminoglycoside phosphotransferase family protein [Bacteroidota bacterium]
MKKEIDGILDRLRTEPERYFGSAQPPELHIVKKVWRPYSRVYRVEARQGGAVSRFFWVKMFIISERILKKAEKHLARIKTEFDIAQELSEHFTTVEHIHVVQPMALFPDKATVVTWESPGEPLSTLIEKKARLWPAAQAIEEIEQYMHLSGKALATMQKLTRTEELFDPAALRDYVDIRLQRLVKIRSARFSEAMREQVLNTFDRLIPEIPQEHLWVCGKHGDFGAFNILAGNGEVTLTDFTMYGPGSPYIDVSYFIHRLRGFLHKPTYRPEIIARFEQAFVDGYGVPDVREHALFTLSMIRHVTNNYSSLARNRIGGYAKIPMPHKLWFNKKIFRSYHAWLEQTCHSPG